ncbi:uncharacterized protein LOC129234395 [Uloborus diversus]|uniref:uncharacterized protein LOC129234395 n=1 Tax=Uloborus diversus TaxID=327109 RepID=UPI00240933C6|nr:uncharacterized protein LOC129234395 [Uloborus diversus]
MWRVCRKTIFPRWHVNRQNPVENQKQSGNSKPLVLAPFTHKGYSDGNSNRQHAHKKEKFWEDPQFQFRTYGSSILETAGWLGAAVVLCLNVHVKHIKLIYERDKSGSSCIFRRHAYGMPQHVKKEEKLLNPQILPFSRLKLEKDKTTELLGSFKMIASHYTAAVQNSAGVANINADDRKAFRHFQRAARLGSSEGLYNLALCYELGKGTRINLHRAAFCYQKATSKGHGLAAFNLAVYFFKGLGGLPIDENLAKVLIAEAAKKGVPEAQTFIGLDYLETEKWSEAFTVFNSLAEKGILDGKYYLGVCYENGWGVNKNEAAAAELFAQTAALGHKKSILKLGSYYETGKGGCDNDCDFAKALYQILADYGCDEGQKALINLKLKQQKIYEDSLTHLQNSTIQRSKLHSSSSFPQLSSTNHSWHEYFHHLPALPHLNLITPYKPAEKSEVPGLKKPIFCGQENVQDLSMSNIIIQNFRNIPPIVVGKT